MLLLQARGTCWNRYSRHSTGLGWRIGTVLSSCWGRARRVWVGDLLCSLRSHTIGFGSTDGAVSVDGNGRHSDDFLGRQPSRVLENPLILAISAQAGKSLGKCLGELL